MKNNKKRNKKKKIVQMKLTQYDEVKLISIWRKIRRRSGTREGEVEVEEEDENEKEKEK